MNNDMLDNLFGVADPGNFTDGFDAVGEDVDGYPQPMWFTGYKNPIINPASTKTVMAKGFAFEVKKCPKDLKEVFEKLILQKKARKVLVEHQGEEKKTKQYYQFTAREQSFFPLIHGMPKRSAIEQNPALQISIAAGKRIEVLDKKKPILYRMETFFGFLAVSQTLYEAGYVEDDGTPKLISIRAKGTSTDELWAVLQANANFVRAARDAGVDPRGAQLWAYRLAICPTENPVEHGKGGETTMVHTYENATFEVLNPEYESSRNEELYCGDKLYQLLFPLLYNQERRPAEPGGLVALWCRKTCAKALADRLKIDPEQQLKVGTWPAPAWLLTADMRRDAGLPVMEAVKPQRGEPVQGDSTQRLKDEFEPALRKLRLFFKAQGDQQGLGLILEARNIIEYIEESEADRRVAVQELLEDAAKRRVQLRDATPVDPYEL